ncbi:hypothetical protein LINGRAPRIM_LOCUS2807, partial [Linum grandiflorum]
EFSFLRLRGLRSILNFLRSVSLSDSTIALFSQTQSIPDLQVVPVLFQHSLKVGRCQRRGELGSYIRPRDSVNNESFDGRKGGSCSASFGRVLSSSQGEHIVGSSAQSDSGILINVRYGHLILYIAFRSDIL